ncbi:MAG: leucine--tRNA ligase [Candidatus Wildermuthbacteria bacterium RIFCSPHIGHO2_01_FULL_45_20]|nr:MAG: leucine--tRNA ligase [Candidatus Wildermuthbacteria bacterium RIFCSPHIGHO2_01_FULL_45_20]
MSTYDSSKIEKKWQKKWEEKGMHQAQEKSDKQKLYVLDMFPYPSGSGLHVGHVEGYTATDIYSRFKRMQGYNVLHPMGWDAFGLPAENYAIKTGVPPKETTENAIKTFTKQIKSLGLSYDWSREIGTHTPEYYKWTQWFFLLLYKNGFAYKAKANVNWCDSCKTVLANEQVINGKCERCSTQVVQKELEQWFFKITDFAEDLINDLDKVDWPASTKLNQRNWIGKKEGIDIAYEIEGFDEKVVCFTTRPDTNFGATFIVLGAEHPLVEKITIPKYQNEVQLYVEKTLGQTEEDRIAQGRVKTGAFTGRYAINNLNGKKLPIWVSDFVLGYIGTGAVVGVPGHDMRDFEFASAFGIPVERVVIASDGDASSITRVEQVQEGEGKMVNSEFLDGMEIHKAKGKMMDYLEEKGWGKRVTTYHLRDWLVSRQRYWGAPIPIVYDPEGNAHAIPEEHLPWLLPTDVEFRPTGTSPLAESKELHERTEKIFGKGWKPEVDTMDTFVCSSWYYFRFADPQNTNEFANKQAIEQWLPVDMYMGGAEHTVLHLMYARFFTKALKKFGYVNFDEPFLKLRHQGIILGEDGHKMSKSKGNVINPDDIISQFGADTLRMFEMFLGPIGDMKPWSSKNIIGVRRFLDRVWDYSQAWVKAREKQADAQVISKLHQTVKKVTEHLEELRFNTAISSMMELVNALRKTSQFGEPQFIYLSPDEMNMFVRLLAPFVPHLAEELWEQTGNAGSVHEQPWPSWDKTFLQSDTLQIVAQVNGKVRDTLEVPANSNKEQMQTLVLRSEKVQKWLQGKTPKTVIVIPGKLVNVVV